MSKFSTIANNKSTLIALRVSHQTKQKIESISKKKRISQSEYLRRIIAKDINQDI